MKWEGFLYLEQDMKAYYNGVLLAGIYIIVANLLFGNMCPCVLLTGFPCPACGLTKAGFYVMTLQLHKAWIMNPAIYAVGMFLLYFIICRYVLGKSVFGWKWILWGMIILLMVVYLYRIASYFPEEMMPGEQWKTPMHYEHRNLLRWCLRQSFSR